jgi:hypothetical protein
MIKAELGLDISDFQGGIKKASQGFRDLEKSSSGGFLSKITTTWTDLGNIAQTIASGVTSAFRGMYSAMEEGGALVDLAEQTGVGIERLSVLKVAFEQAGLAAGDVQSVVNKMQKAIADAGSGVGGAVAAFDALGIPLANLGAMDAEGQLIAIGDAINKIENPTQKAAVAMEIFGKSGGKMLALFGSGGLAGAEKIVGAQAKMLADNAELFDRTTDVLGQAGMKLRGFFVGIASELGPSMQGFVDAFEEMDLAGVGREFAASIFSAMNAIKVGFAALESIVAPIGTLIEGIIMPFKWIIDSAGKLIDKSAAASKGTESAFTGGAYMGMGMGMGGFGGGGVSQSEARARADEGNKILEAAAPRVFEEAKAGESWGKKFTRQLDELVGLKFVQDAKQGRLKRSPLPGESAFIGPLPESLADKMKRDFAAPFQTPVVAKIEKPIEGPKAGFEFASSLAKIGGSIFGPSVFRGEDQAATYARQQLEQQREAVRKAEQTNILLKIIAEKNAGGSPVYA